jgi:signal transduction histidine kinase
MRLAVRHKLVLLAAVILVGVSFVFLAIDLHLARRFVEEDVQGRVIAFARVLAASISTRHELESGAALQHQVARIRGAREDVLQLDVLAFVPQGGVAVVATTDAERRLPFTWQDTAGVRQGRVASRLGEGGRYQDVMAPITLDGAVVGAVVARFSSEPAERLAGRIRTAGLLFTGTAVVVMALLMTVAVRYVVDRPVRHVVAAIDRLRAGDAAATVPVATDDEFGALARHFNELMARVRRFNDELQERVREATGELDRRYRQVQQLEALRFELQRRLAQAERLAVSGRVMAEVAHEVGTPLHSVAGHVELLRRDAEGQLGADAARRLAIVEAQVLRVIEIIARLLDLTRPPAGETRPVDLNGLVGEVAELAGPALSAAGLDLRLGLAPDLPAVEGQRDQLQQVTLNLLTNAMDATPAGGTVAVTTRAVPESGEVELAVSDTGPGIPPADRDRIFEPFFTTKPAGRGTGLGLFVTGQIVRDHKGRIELVSPAGGGARLVVRLPALARLA